jgi:hypothetical protein
VPETDVGAANVKRVIAGAVAIGADRERSFRRTGAGARRHACRLGPAGAGGAIRMVFAPADQTAAR